MPIDDLAKVDYSLNSLPAVFHSFIDLDLKVIACSAICQCWVLFLYDPLSQMNVIAVLNIKT